MIDRVFGIKVRMSGLCINRYRPIISHCLIGASLHYSAHWLSLGPVGIETANCLL